jgi:hypothetical protein
MNQRWYPPRIITGCDYATFRRDRITAEDNSIAADKFVVVAILDALELRSVVT